MHAVLDFHQPDISGANQLLWYYADLERQRCFDEQKGVKRESNLIQGTNETIYGQEDVIKHDINHCLAYRRFAK